MSKKSKYSLEDFITLDKENEGLRFFLETPQGEVTDIWVTLYGAGSDAMKAASAVCKAKSKKTGKEPSPELDSPENIEYLASAIKDWNLDIPCNYDNRVKLVSQSRPARTYINTVLTNDRLYFLLGQPHSSEKGATQNGSSNSGSETKAE